MQTRCLPVRDLTIRGAQRVCRPRGDQTEYDVRAMALVEGYGQNHRGPRLRNPGAWEGCDYEVPGLQVCSRSRSSKLDKDARRASARFSSVQVSDQSTLLPFAPGKSGSADRAQHPATGPWYHHREQSWLDGGDAVYERAPWLTLLQVATIYPIMLKSKWMTVTSRMAKWTWRLPVDGRRPGTSLVGLNITTSTVVECACW